MSISKDFSQKNQEVILNTLQSNDSPLQLLELKKRTALANLFFFEGLKALEQKQLIQKIIIEGKTYISLSD
ncbi:MAG: hypothetical protein JSW11_18055 [Candidatus Heimdallarchaeota archaeon]|nr:MAG: hypothetical protein JSW11_18055 [Candidatus Heimdallarchaeota archaeon]